MHQLHNHIFFKPIDTNILTPEKRKKSMEILLLLTEKRNGSMKGRTCANGSTKRLQKTKVEASSPIAATESMVLMAAMEVK